MRGEALIQEMETLSPNFNIRNNVTDFKENCENIQASILNFPKSDNKHLKKMLESAALEFENTIKDFSDMVKNLWFTIRDNCVQLYKYIVNTYKQIIKWFKGEYQKVCNLWKKFKRGGIGWEELWNNIKDLSNDALDAFGWFILVDLIETIWDLIKDIWGTSKALWKRNIKYFRELRDNFKEDTTSCKKINDLLQLIIPLLAQIAVITLSIIELSKKKQEKAIENNIFDDPDIELHSKLLNYNYDNSYLIKHLQEHGNIPEQYQPIFKDNISVCPVYDIDEEIFLQEKNGYIVEIGKNISDYRFIKSEGEKVNYDDIIGYIEDIPIKSILSGIIIDVTDRWLTILPDDETVTEEGFTKLSGEISNNFDKNDFQEIYNKYLTNSYIEDLYRNYLYDGIKSIFLSNYKSRNLLADYKNVDSLYLDIINYHSSKTEEHDNLIKKLCDADNIKNKSESEIIKLKDEIYNIKTEYINKLHSYIFDNDIKREYREKIERKDYLLFDYYLEFYINKINYEYKTDNQYIVKFFNIIKDFLNERFFIEENSSLTGLIKKFNNIALHFSKNNYFEYINKNIKDITFDIVNEFINMDLIKSISSEDDIKIVKKLSILFCLIKDIEKSIKTGIFNIERNEFVKVSKHNGSLTELKNRTIKEREIIISFIEELKNNYIVFNDLETMLSGYNRQINWPSGGNLFVNNVNYIHYLFSDFNPSGGLSEQDFDEILNDQDNKNYEIDTYNYWLKYCAIATLMNCANPLYWATGLILPSGPLQLPIILIPITFIKGKCSCLIGLGICGIAIYPFMLYINMSSETMSYIIVINILLEQFGKMMSETKKITMDSVKKTIEPMIKTLDEKIKALDADIKLLDNEILMLKSV